jgi:hypothetical protein
MASFLPKHQKCRIYYGFRKFYQQFTLELKLLISLQPQNTLIMAPKKTSKASKKTTSKKNNNKTGIAGLYGIFKGRIHYKDDSIFNLGV